MNLHFEEHYPLRSSRLEQWRDEITAMRTAKWPHQQIAKWLQTEQHFTISAEAVRQFCKVRGILKPMGATQLAPRSQRERGSKNKPRKPPTSEKNRRLFEYDDSKPIQIKRR